MSSRSPQHSRVPARHDSGISLSDDPRVTRSGVPGTAGDVGRAASPPGTMSDMSSSSSTNSHDMAHTLAGPSTVTRGGTRTGTRSNRERTDQLTAAASGTTVHPPALDTATTSVMAHHPTGGSRQGESPAGGTASHGAGGRSTVSSHVSAVSSRTSNGSSPSGSGTFYTETGYTGTHTGSSYTGGDSRGISRGFTDGSFVSDADQSPAHTVTTAAPHGTDGRQAELVAQWERDIAFMDSGADKPERSCAARTASCAGRAIPWFIARFPCISLMLILAGVLYLCSLTLYPETKPVTISVGACCMHTLLCVSSSCPPPSLLTLSLWAITSSHRHQTSRSSRWTVTRLRSGSRWRHRWPLRRSR